MRKTILTILAASLLAASSAQLAAAAEHHHFRKQAAATEQFRNAHNAILAPAQPGWYPNSLNASDYSEAHMNMVGR